MIEHSRDFRRIKHLSDLYPAEGYDKWSMQIGTDVYYLIEIKNDRDLGVWVFEPHEEGYLMHAAMGPDCRGRKAKKSGLEAINWIFSKTNAEYIIAATPEELKHTHILPRVAGFEYKENKDGFRCFILNRDKFSESSWHTWKRSA